MRVRLLVATVAAVAFLGGGCGHGDAARPRSAPAAGEIDPRADVVVIAPHPDDETLIAGGVLHAAVKAGKRVGVIVVTNGDFTCARDGFVRQREAIDALASLGVHEEQVTFLGYPDGHLARLGAEPLAPVERRAADGSCSRGATTYGARGRGSADTHTVRTGSAATYTADALRDDLAAELARMRPRDVYVTHPIDAHADHAAVYAYVRRALDALAASTDGWTPERVHRAVVHAGPCWPNGAGMAASDCSAEPYAPASAMPPLPPPLAAYVPSERVPLPATLRAEGKLAAIARFPSQTGPEPKRDWLASFARTDEVFYVETYTREDGAWVRARSAAITVTETLATLVAAAADDASATLTPEVAIVLAPAGTALTLTRRGVPLRTWTLPDDATRLAPHAFAVRIDARADDAATEITVRRDGAVLGVAISVDPRP